MYMSSLVKTVQFETHAAVTIRNEEAVWNDWSRLKAV